MPAISVSSFAKCGGMLMVLLGLGGCFGGGSSNPDLVEVTGVVTMDGQPMKDVSVVFEPEAGGNASRGTTEADGSFRLMYDRQSQGALPGSYRVHFMVMSADSTGPQIPSRYSRSRSDMTVEVTEEGPNEFPLELKSK